jgi:hypothetical protein
MAPDPKRDASGPPHEWLDIPDPLSGRALASKATPSAAPSERSPTRADLKRRRQMALMGSMLWAIAVLAFFGFRPGLAQTAPFVAGQTIVWALLLTSALVLSIGAGRSGFGGPLTMTRALTFGAPFLFLILGLFWLPAGTTAAFGAFGPMWGIVNCFLVGILTAAPVVLLAFWAVRRSFPSAAGWRGALLGAGSGLAASIVLTLHCASPNGGHIAVAHGLPIVVSAVAGAFLGTKVARA